MKIEQDKRAKSISFFNKQSVISKKQILNLIGNKSKNFKSNCRLSINSSSKDNINCMIIFQKNFIPEPKYYLKKDKIFFCYKGKMIFLFFDKKMNFFKSKENKKRRIYIY